MKIFNMCDLGKGAEKKMRQKYGLLPNQGGGVSEGNKKPNPFFGKVFFQWAFQWVESF